MLLHTASFHYEAFSVSGGVNSEEDESSSSQIVEDPKFKAFHEASLMFIEFV